MYIYIDERKFERYTIIYENHQEVRKSIPDHCRPLYYYYYYLLLLLFYYLLCSLYIAIDKPHQLYEPCPCPVGSVQKKAEKIRTTVISAREIFEQMIILYLYIDITKYNKK